MSKFESDNTDFFYRRSSQNMDLNFENFSDLKINFAAPWFYDLRILGTSTNIQDI
jgi:hypothetical protein